MEAFYTYIWQVNVGLAVFYVFYRALFVRDTFLGVRRLCLWTAWILAFVYPLVSLDFLQRESMPLQGVLEGYAEAVSAVVLTAVPDKEAMALQWQDWVALVWGIGMAVLLVRMLVQCVGVFRLALRGRSVYWHGQRLIVLEDGYAPFSFFGWVFVNPAHHDGKEMEEIMIHERTHVRQWHSVDMVVGELLCCLFWFNPVVWLLRRAVRQNLEFLADEEVVASGCNRKNYQYHLLRLSNGMAAAKIVNNFNVSPLKKRIVMMNKKRTSRIGLVKYALLLPLTGLLILSANADVVAEATENTVGQWSMKNKDGQVEGRVVDENGKPLQGVSVILQGTSTGTITDAEGYFALKTDVEGTLCFSFVGRKTRLVSCKPGMKDVKVVLPEEAQELERLVVVGYGKPEKQAPKAEEEVFVVVEEMPEFQGGDVLRFLAERLRYPVLAQEKGVQGTVYVSFVVDKTGKVVRPEVVRGVHEALDREAVRVVGEMPRWKPGRQRGMAVDVRYTLPIEFKLQPAVEDSGKESSSVDTEGKAERGMVLQGGTEDVRKLFAEGNKGSALVIVDGKAMPSDFDMNSMEMERIKSVTVLKSETALKLYGEKAKDGAIVVVTK